MDILYTWWVRVLDMLAVINVETVDTFGFILGTVATVGLLCLVALGWLAVRAPGRLYRWTALVLVVFISVTVLTAIDLQRSLPRDMTPELQRRIAPHGLQIVPTDIDPPNYIYFTAKVGNRPHFYRIKWTEPFEKEVLDKQKEAGEGGKDSKDKQQGLVLEFAPSDEDRPMPHIYLRPWPAQPSKGTLDRPYEFQPTGY
ncbi:hypothetical protein HY413_04045 [Candidatus Kaiserbacteria bacterium]|nr:hypothetical protein [Candidatus Kaiserbacteria bacterium]